MPKTTALVFDLDGTLIDSLPSIHAAVNAVMDDFSVVRLGIDQVRDFIGYGAPHLITKVCALRNISDKEIALNRLLKHYDRAHTLTRPYAHVIETLQHLDLKGYKLGLCTNKPAAATETALIHNGLSGFFNTIISGDSMAQRKPAKEPLLAIANALNADRIFFIGDSEIDAETAKAADIPFILFQEGYLHIDIKDINKVAVFDNYKKLPELLTRI